MSNLNLITEGFQLMLIGMSVVFIFLSLLVLCTTWLQHFSQENNLENHTLKKTTSHQTDQISEEEIAVITSAIYRYRQENQ